VTYIRRPAAAVTTDGLIAKTLNGTQLRGLVINDGTLATGNNDQSSIIPSITRVAAFVGGADRSNGEFEMTPQADGVSGVYTWGVRSISLSADTGYRIEIGSSWTGAGNVLSNGVFVLEYIP